MPHERRHPPFDRRRPVLIVSGNPDVVDLYVLTWRSERYPVASVSSVSDGAHLLRERAVSAVVLDVSAPNADWEACRELRALAEPGLPVVVLTGWIDAGSLEQALEHGCAAFVAKPASAERLREVVERARAGEHGIVAVP